MIAAAFSVGGVGLNSFWKRRVRSAFRLVGRMIRGLHQEFDGRFWKYSAEKTPRIPRIPQIKISENPWNPWRFKDALTDRESSGIPRPVSLHPDAFCAAIHRDCGS